MGPGWTQALRFPAGSRLRFTRTLAAPMRAAIEKESANAATWLALADDAITTVEAVDASRCVMRASASASTNRAEVECFPGENATFGVRASVERESTQHARTFSDVVIMLGGPTDVYLAERTETATRHLIRLRYDRNATQAELAIFTAPFARHLSAAIRALLPTIVVLGRFEVVT